MLTDPHQFRGLHLERDPAANKAQHVRAGGVDPLAWAWARWSIQTMTFCASFPVGLKLTGAPRASMATSEQVASKPMPWTVT